MTYGLGKNQLGNHKEQDRLYALIHDGKVLLELCYSVTTRPMLEYHVSQHITAFNNNNLILPFYSTFFVLF